MENIDYRGYGNGVVVSGTRVLGGAVTAANVFELES